MTNADAAGPLHGYVTCLGHSSRLLNLRSLVLLVLRHSCDKQRTRRQTASAVPNAELSLRSRLRS